MYHAHNEKGRKTKNRKIELPNQERIRTLGEKANYNYLGTVDAGSIKQVLMKERNNKIEPQKNFWKLNSTPGFSLKEKTFGQVVL